MKYVFGIFCAAMAVLSTQTSFGQTILVSANATGIAGNASSNTPTASGDGRYVAFESDADNLVSGDLNNTADIFVRDALLGLTTRASVSSSGSEGNGTSTRAAISADGRYVAFQSAATNLVLGDTNGVRDVFVRDLQSETTERVSVSSSGGQGNTHHDAPAISADGRFVAFHSESVNLVPNDTNDVYDVFVHDRQTRTTTRVSVSSLGQEGNAPSRTPSVSSDGRFVAYWSWATNLVPTGNNGRFHIYVHDRQTGTTERVSVNDSGTSGDGNSASPSISGDGRYVTFHSDASNLVPDDNNGVTDVFVRDRLTRHTSLVSVNFWGVAANGASYGPSISADGQYASFASRASDLISGDINGYADVFRRNLQLGITVIVSVGPNGQGNNDSGTNAIPGDGDAVAFSSAATNLVPGGTTGNQVFINGRPSSCARSAVGNVNVAIGPAVDVLFVNGSAGGTTRTVNVGIGVQIRIVLNASPSGPNPSPYTFLAWSSPPVNPLPLMILGQQVGCTANPTPLDPGELPQPAVMLNGTMPFQLDLPDGVNGQATFTIQAVILDAGAGNPLGVSVTNAVIVEIR